MSPNSVWTWRKERYAGYEGRVLVRELNAFGLSDLVTVELLDLPECRQRVRTFPTSYWKMMERVA